MPFNTDPIVAVSTISARLQDTNIQTSHSVLFSLVGDSTTLATLDNVLTIAVELNIVRLSPDFPSIDVQLSPEFAKYVY